MEKTNLYNSILDLYLPLEYGEYEYCGMLEPYNKRHFERVQNLLLGTERGSKQDISYIMHTNIENTLLINV